jgi:hypothetical protein
MSIEAFKESIVNPLKKSIEHHRDVKLSHFRSREDVTRQWDISVGMEMSLNHIETTYSAMMNQKHDTSLDVEILSPQN